MSEFPPNYYPRNMVGYGANPPDPQWPGPGKENARIAVQFVVNYEEGGENSVLHGDAASEAFLSEITGAQPWPGRRHWNMESIYEFGSRAGFWRIRQAFEDAGIKPTVYGVATALMRSPEQAAAMQQAGWEMASHGLKWIDYKDVPAEAEYEDMLAAIRIHEEVTGAKPGGWYTGRCSVNTVDMIARHGGFDWCSDTYDDDLPYWYDAHMENGEGDPLLIIPYTLDANDMRFAITAGYDHAEPFYLYLKDAFDALYEEGKRGAPKMMNVGLHCRLVGRPGRIGALKRFLDYVAGHDHVWTPTRGEIAAHWRKVHPYKPRPHPSRMAKNEFVAAYGSIFEHSPWIAERAWEKGLGPANDTALGLASALTQVFRGAPGERRLEVLMAHPDLAGKLAVAKRLTAESTAEQAGAGLDSLTDAEKAAFTELNSSYMAKFGFPFIMAVKGRGKDEILSAFRQRVNHDRETEFATACAEVEKIALLRLNDMLP